MPASPGKVPARAEDVTSALWRELAATYPRHPADLDGPAKRAFRRLAIADQREAVRWLPEYLRRWATEKANGLRGHLPHRKTWLEGSGWLTVATPPAAPPAAPTLPTTGNDRHDKILGAIATELGAETFGSWFGECRVVDVDEATVVLAWPKAFTRSHVRERLGQRVCEAVRAVEPHCRRVNMIVGTPPSLPAMDSGAMTVMPASPHLDGGARPAPAKEFAGILKDARHLTAEVLALVEDRERR